MNSHRTIFPQSPSDMTQPRYFPAGSEQPRPIPVSPGPETGGEGAVLMGRRRVGDDLQEMLDSLGPTTPSRLGFEGYEQDPRITDSVLEAMLQLERLFTEGPVLGVPDSGHAAPRPPAPPAPQSVATSREQGLESEPRTRGNLVLLALMALVGLGVASASILGVAHLRRAPKVTQASIVSLNVPNPSPVIAGYLARAEAGDRVAMRLLITCYRDGLDTPEDSYEASRWTLRAALSEPIAPSLAQVGPSEEMAGARP